MFCWELPVNTSSPPRSQRQTHNWLEIWVLPRHERMIEDLFSASDLDGAIVTPADPEWEHRVTHEDTWCVGMSHVTAQLC